MIRWRAAIARLPQPAAATVAWLLAALALVLTTLAVGCGPFSRDLEPGSYSAVLELPGGELPFGLDVARDEGGFVLYLVNGEERVEIHDVEVVDGKLEAALPGGTGGTLTAQVRGGELSGEVRFATTDGKWEDLPFRAQLGATWRFFEEPLTDNADVSGRWAVTLADDTAEALPGVADLTQSFERVTGTIRTSAGDPRLLAGEIRGDVLHLSRFDGVRAELYRATVDASGEIAGEYWSGRNGHARFNATRNPDAVLTPSVVGVNE
jgi:hypothetical protein